MKRTVFLITIMTLATAIVHAQTEDGTISGEDSLQIAEETPITEDSSLADAGPLQVPSQPAPVLEAFFQALKSGDSLMVSELISDDGLEEISVMLEILKENLHDDPEAVMSRLSAAGYVATADEIKDWSPMEYLTHTVVLPVMKARYAMYEMEIGDFSNGGNELEVPLTFISSAGVQLPFQADLVKDRDDWKVSTFMGLNSFP